MFEWNHLPLSGGIWDQDPEFLKAVRIINTVIAAVEKRKKDREKYGDRPPPVPRNA